MSERDSISSVPADERSRLPIDSHRVDTEHPREPERQPHSTVTEYEWDESQPIATVIVEAVAAVCDCKPTTLQPLEELVDTDALDNIFRPIDTRARTTASVSFVFEGCAVTVVADGTIKIERLEV